MNCFVIMPFSRDFDDVYATIKNSVEGALSTNEGRCFRLDEARPAGRITDRLLTELQTASMCVADLTGNKPNVMWEIGYAMALGKPMIIVTQSLQDLPFDLKDMQSLEYERNHLNDTLGRPLRRMVIDTISSAQRSMPPPVPSPAASNELIAELRGQVDELKSIVSQAVRVWGSSQPQTQPTKDESRQLMNLEGAWFSRDSGSLKYGVMVNGDLVMPYCYGGDDALVGVYYGWRMVGEHWFGRFTWLDAEISGFAFLKQESVDILTGAWWNDEEGVPPPEAPPMKSGVQITWERKQGAEYPAWATQFIEEVRQEGLENCLSRYKANSSRE